MENNIPSAPTCDCNRLERHAYRDNNWKTAIFKRWVYRCSCLMADGLKVFVHFWT